MQLVFNCTTGAVMALIPKNQDAKTYFNQYPRDIRDNIGALVLNEYPRDLENYRVMGNQLERIPDIEITEIRQYGKVLTEEERLLNKLKPSYEEIKKAQNTIEILTLIQEVM